MIKNISKVEHVIGERVFQLLCDTDSPISEVKEALLHFIKIVGQIEDAVLKSKNEEKNKNDSQPEFQEEINE